LAFRCTDGYTESLDMPSARHPQTTLATNYAGEPIGFPLRLRTRRAWFQECKVISIEVTASHQGAVAR
jgi:DMSO/TMAO reductase YedYZ molybdopterin-dependent catalytic subunit